MKNNKSVHYTAQYLIDPQHPVTVNVIGCGGTGSQVLSSLARMNSALKALGHPGLFVRAWDPDRVTVANMGRQLFSPVEVDEFKSAALISRINRFFGYEWEAMPEVFKAGSKNANITISCVDTGKARKEIKGALLTNELRHRDPYHVPFYWMDFGNMMDRGQVVIGTVRPIPQPKKSEFITRASLPTIDKIHKSILVDKAGENQGPSCSLAEALDRQDLFINTNLANMGLAILWKMFRNLHIEAHGLYLNLQNLTVNPIKIK